MRKKFDEQLIHATLNGDIESFGTLARRYYSAMVAIAYSRLNDRHLAEDAAQEALSRALVNLVMLRRKERFAFWLGRITRNAADDIARRKNIAVDPNEIAAFSQENKDQSEIQENVQQAIRQLNPVYRELVTLRYFDSCSYEEIGAVLGLTPAAINGKLTRAKRKIAEYMKRHGFMENQP
ncbi:MAG: sigma-70 family RNA polymerase sigma factor [Sedimentisphaerales bacterium]|nr:sigma-70 family RNA polymerase sigma factor [Sedimentisphaerales bacterium]